MSFKSMLLRFAVMYPALLVLVSALVSYLGLQALGAHLGSAVLIGTVWWLGLGFARHNQRFFSAREKYAALGCFIGLDLLLQAGIAAQLLNATPGLRADALFGQLALVGATHALMVWFFLGYLGRKLARHGIAAPQPV